MARQFQDDGDYDDRPRKRRAADDDDDVDEGVSSRKRPGARARGDDYEDEDDFDRPRKKKKAGSKGLIIGLSVGGGVLVLAIVGLVLFFVLKGGGGGGDTQKLLVGTWQMNDAGPFALKVEFTADGRFIEDLAVLKLQHKYKVINASTLEVETDMAGGFGDMFGKFKGMPGVPGDFKVPNMNMNVKRNITVNVTQNDLTLTEQGLVKKYRRVN